MGLCGSYGSGDTATMPSPKGLRPVCSQHSRRVQSNVDTQGSAPMAPRPTAMVALTAVKAAGVTGAWPLPTNSRPANGVR